MSKQNLISIILSFIPVSYILGTFILNLNIFLLILIGLFLYAKGYRYKIELLDKLIILFFIYILFTGLWNTIEIQYLNQKTNTDYYILNKSFFFLRYLFLYLTIRLLIEKDLINFKLIFIVYSLTVFLVSVDVIIQFFIGKNLLGQVSPNNYKVTGFFQDEAIAGGFIQRFSLFLFYTISVFVVTKKNNFKIYALSILFLIIILSIIFSGNRMPLILFILSIILILFTNQTLKKYFLHIFILLTFTLTISIYSSPKLKNYYKTFYKQTIKIISLYNYRITGIGSDLLINKRPFYIHEFDSGISTFKLNKFIGGGVKSFRFNCPKRKIENINERIACNMHPHNYYLEILTDLGLLGFFIFLTLVIVVLKKSYRLLISSDYKYICSPFFYVFLMEIFPLKSSGSFFTTNNSVIIFFVLSVLVGYINKSKFDGGPTGNRTPIR